ncbi:LOW QUALITY PROTEIN: hypothetical protein CFC21_108161 [Triticum aestivum]|uniref:Peptidase A1 domain-containing protein n=2 Tax=Triticum aestivum TaxID=4565 RepID=A0A9R1NBC8_WHEAT|nr:LOW QUALITY PROTEIN: hypothetical protein CFC21_108161 [Triticum aestivum]
MASASSPPLVALGVLLLLLSVSSAIAHGGGAHQERRRQRYMVAQTSHLMEPKSICSGLKVTPSANGTWVPLHRPYGPCSPSEGTPPPLVEMLRWDQARTDYVRRKATGEVDDVLHPARPHVDMMQVDFMLRGSFGIGSGSGGQAAIDEDDEDDPMVLSQTMAIDTTEDVPWIQCLPCPIPQCYPQRNAFFDPRRSSTGAPVRCGSRACRTLGGYANGCSKPNSTGDCLYRIEYSDHRLTLGTYMTDTLTISPSTTFLNFRFGCSHAVRGKFSAQASGTMSLGGGPQSLLSQTARAYGNAFSYCVPAPSAAGFLSIGGPADGDGGGGSGTFATTPLVRNANVINPTIYVVRLEGIEVAGRRLNVPPVVFSGGTVMDSSAIITQLPPTAYRALRLAFRNAMGPYKTRAPTGNLDTCFDFVGVTNVTVPAVSLVFDGGAVIELDLLAVLLDGCLAFAPVAADFALGFIGNVQQQTHEVLYDVAGGAVGFRRGAC